MAIVKPLTDFNALEIRRIIGKPNGLGQHFLGLTALGDDSPYAGIYQKRPRQNGQIFVKMKFYYPQYSGTTLQLTQREKFANAITSWQALTIEEKNVYNAMQYPPRMTGFNRFIRLYMRDEI